MPEEAQSMIDPYGALAPGRFDHAVIRIINSLPDNWLGRQFASGMRRLVTMRLHGDGGLDVERWGLRMRLFPRRNLCEKRLLFAPQLYETRERAELAGQIDRAKAAGRTFVFVDIGANVGLFSFFVAACAGSGAKILAIEPEPGNISRLRFNIAANPGLSIRVVAHALGERAESVALEIDRRDKGGTRTRPLNDQNRAADRDRIEVDCRTLLQVLTQEAVQYIDALKIDVEGTEDAILVPFFGSAPERLWPRFLIIEDTHDLWRVDLFSELAALGYTVAARTKLNVMMQR